MSDLLDLVLKQIRACEDSPGSLLPAVNKQMGAYVACQGEWDVFLFRTPECPVSEPVEIVPGLESFCTDVSIEDEDGRFSILRALRNNRLHFSGFIVDLIERLDESDFTNALDLTLGEWRSRWTLRATGLSFIQRVGLYGELVVLRDFINSGRATDSSSWIGRDKGDGLHDFRIGSQIFEVKTTTIPIAEIHIFDEDQMHHTDGLFLLLVKTDISVDGQSIDDIANEIMESINSIGNRLVFRDKLLGTGFEFDKYQEDRFVVRSKNYWESDSSRTPFIQYTDINRALRKVSNISYHILEEDVPFTELHSFAELLEDSEGH